jgi:uncharacterized coiled-coil protein SlyX
MLKECNLEKIVAEANKDIDDLNEKITDKLKDNESLAVKLEKLIELKFEMEQKKEKNKNNYNSHNTNNKKG